MNMMSLLKDIVQQVFMRLIEPIQIIPNLLLMHRTVYIVRRVILKSLLKILHGLPQKEQVDQIMQICKKKGARRLQKDLNINWEEKY